MRLLKARRKAEPQTLELRWLTVDAADTPSHPGAIDEIMGRRIDGMSINGVVTPAEVDRALEVLEQHRHVEGTPEPFGTMLGMPLHQLGPDASDRHLFLDETEMARPVYEKAFGFDPHQRIAEVLQPMTSGRPVAPPVEEGRAYNPGNVRWYDPHLGGLRSHVGNEFRYLAEQGAMEHLIQTTAVEDHLSYFVVLQPPSEGGALAVFDLLWEDENENIKPWDSAMRDDRWFDTRSASRFSPGPGDMILFGGGWRWHRVDPVAGDRPRITYGGFAAPSRDDRELHLWC